MSSPRESLPQRDSRSASPPAALQQPLTNTAADASHSSTDEDGDIFHPRGRLAARLQARNSDQHASGSETEKGGAETPTEDDEVVTTRPRKLIQRRQRSATPQNTPRQQNQGTAPSPGSPGLFLTPSKPGSPAAGSNAGAGSDSDDDEVPSVTKNSRFLALVAKKRREREAKEAEEARKRAERLAAQPEEDDNMSLVDEEDPDEITDDEGGRKLTQEAARPARKASKKALEEMNRETQRLTRSLQLAHEAKVKKKITKSALFERFNFYPKGAPEAARLPSSQPTTPGSGPQTDGETKDAETPPSSGPLQEGTKDAPQSHNTADSTNVTALDDEDRGLSTLENAIRDSTARAKLDKGKGKAVDDSPADEQQPPPKPKRKFRVKLPEVQVNQVRFEDDDDDLRVEVSHKSKIDAIFDRVPVNMAKESRPMHNLRKLAQLDDPDKQPGANLPKHRQSKHQQPVVSAGELQADLLQRARQQAKLERDRHLETLRAKGVHVQTAEEREQELAQIEDIVAKARQEAEELMQREREAAKEDRKAKKAAGELDPLAWDDSEDDEDYQEEGEDKELAEVELSGSDDEDAEKDDDEEMGEDEGSEVEMAGVVIDDAAETADESEAEEEAEQGKDEDEDEDMPTTGINRVNRRPRKTVAILSDDDEDEPPSIVKATPRPKAKFLESPSAANTTSPAVPTSVLRSATKTFIPGLPVAGPAGLGLTQMFAGTMDDSQAGSPGGFNSPTQPRPTFDVNEFPESNFSLTAQEINGEDMILDSQPTGGKTQDPETQGVQFSFSQSQAHALDSLLPDTQDPSQMSELIEPSQDGGYHNFSPLLQRFVEAPASTVETEKVAESQGEVDHTQSPLVRRTGKLRRRAEIVATTAPSEDEANAEDALEAGDDEFGFGTTATANAFTAMKEAADKEKKRKAAELFNKKKSKAREMVEEQAEESEDEYAGLGGVDGEDSDDSDAEDVKEMIDDETKDDASDERKLAAFYADRERASDEKQVEKLFHDITTGALRRKRGGDWDDLSDEDDGGEARRRLKRRQFAKMQKALFADERISKVAENPRNQAFLKTIEDHGSDDDMDFIFAPSPTVPALVSEDSQSSANGESGPTTIPDSQPQESRRADAHLRRTKDGKKPSHIGDIRESLSSLLDEPLNSSTIIPATDRGSSDEEAEPPSSTATTTTNKENHNPRRRNRANIVDRISLKRNSSSTLSTTSRLAFATTSSSSGTFKVPPLLRRATTNSLVSSSSSTTSSTGVTTNNTSTDASSAKIKKPAGKRSGVNYFARENERRAAVAEMERRREAKKWKGAEGRSEVVGGLFGGGKFE